MHDGYFEEFLPKLRSPLKNVARWSLNGASAVVFPCDAWRSWLSEWVPEDRLHGIPNGIDVGRFAAARRGGGATDRVQVLFVGDLSREKGVEELARAVVGLESRLADKRLELCLVGRTDREGFVAEVQRTFQESGFGERLRIPGPLYAEEKIAAFQGSDIFVLPSHRESFGIVNVEAMASGLPVISTTTGAIPEVVRDGIEGIIVEPRNTAELTTALQMLIENPHLRRRMGQAGRQRAKRYDWGVVWQKIANLYDSILSRVTASD
jgi:glycosyltransferase involved in cell wall biosynthesis